METSRQKEISARKNRVSSLHITRLILFINGVRPIRETQRSTVHICRSAMQIAKEDWRRRLLNNESRTESEVSLSLSLSLSLFSTSTWLLLSLTTRSISILALCNAVVLFFVFFAPKSLQPLAVVFLKTRKRLLKLSPFTAKFS